MEGIVNIEKNQNDIERCIGIVRKYIEIDECLIKQLTLEIMDTSLNIGGDFSDDNIIEITKQYVTVGGVERFLKKSSL